MKNKTKLPSALRAWIALACGLWMIVPLRVIAEIVPGLETVADKLTGKSVDYLLMVTTLAAIACTGYVIRMFIAYVIKSKAEDKVENDQRIKDMKDAHEHTRSDFMDAMRSMNELTTEIRNLKK